MTVITGSLLEIKTTKTTTMKGEQPCQLLIRPYPTTLIPQHKSQTLSKVIEIQPPNDEIAIFRYQNIQD